MCLMPSNPCGRSVPDYVIVQLIKSSIAKNLECSVQLVDLNLSVPRSLPDHSIISRIFDIFDIVHSQSPNDEILKK